MPEKHQTLSQKLHAFYKNIIHFFKEVGAFTWDFCVAYKNEIKKSLNNWQPHFQWTSTAFKAIASFVSTLKTSLKVTPVVFSMLTILSAIPLFHVVLPSFIFEPMIFTPILVAIAAIAGFRTYIEAIERDRLDKKIEDDGKEIIALKDRLKSLEQKLTVSHGAQPPIEHAKIAFIPSSNTKRKAKPSASARERGHVARAR